MKKRQKTVKNKVKKNNCGGICIGFNEKYDDKCIGCSNCGRFFAEVPEEVLVKMTKEKPKKELKNQFLSVYMTSEKTGRKCKI